MKIFSYWITALLLSLSFVFSSHGQVLLEDFNRPNSATVGNSWTEVETGDPGSGASIVGNLLELSSPTAGGIAGRTYVYRDVSTVYNTTYSSNAGTITWAFNMESSVTPTSFGAGGVGVAYVLGSTSSNFISSGNGYAVVYGHNGAKLRLVRFTNGLGTASNISGFVSTSTNITPGKFSIKVTYNPTNQVWSLFYRTDGASFSDPLTGSFTSVGNASNSTYTSIPLNFSGAYFNYSTSANIKANFDNIYRPSSIVAPSCPTLTAPSNAATSVCPNSVNFKWTAGSTGNASATSYFVYIGTDGGGVTLPTNLVNGFNNGISTSYQATNLLSNTTYYWAVVPSNSAGTPSGCTINSFTTTINPTIGTVTTDNTNIGSCTGVSSANLTLSSYTGGTLRWQLYNGSTWSNINGLNNMMSINVSPAATTSYRANVSTSGCSNVISNTITITVPTTPTYIATLTSPYIQSFSASPSCLTTSIVSGTTDWTYAANFTSVTGKNITPYSGSHMAVFNAPTGSKAQLITPIIDLTSPSITKPWLSFACVGGKNGTADNLKVYLSSDGGSTWGTAVATYTPEYSWFTNQWQRIGNIDLATYDGANVRIMFEAESFGGSPIALDEIHVFNMSCITPSGLATIGTDYYSTTFTWNAQGDSAQVRYRKVGTTTWIYSPYLTTNSWAWNKLVPNTNFEWELLVWCGAGAVTSTSVFTTTNDAPALSGMNVTGISYGKATFSWAAVTGAVRYRVSVSSDNGTTWSSPIEVTGTSRLYTTLSSGVSYKWRVSPVYGYLYLESVGTYLGPNFSTLTCEATNLAYNLTAPTTVKFTWDAIPGATRYWTRISSDNGVTWSNPVFVTTPTRTYSGLAPGTTYLWQVAGACDGAIRNYIDGPSFSTVAPKYALMDSGDAVNKVVVYPNPVEDFLSVYADSVSTGSYIQIVDTYGKTIAQISITESLTVIPTAELSSGLYILYIVNNQEVDFVTKFIKK
jgi:hypothetical protein